MFLFSVDAVMIRIHFVIVVIISMLGVCFFTADTQVAAQGEQEKMSVGVTVGVTSDNTKYYHVFDSFFASICAELLLSIYALNVYSIATTIIDVNMVNHHVTLFAINVT